MKLYEDRAPRRFESNTLATTPLRANRPALVFNRKMAGVLKEARSIHAARETPNPIGMKPHHAPGFTARYIPANTAQARNSP